MDGLTFRELIKKLREEKGLSKLELAEKMGVSVVHINNWEQGRFLPTKYNLFKLANALDFDYSQLLELMENGRNNLN